MKKVMNSSGLTLICLAIGLITLGCNETTQTSLETPTDGTTLTSSTTGSCCAACAQSELAVAKTGDCSDCPTCAQSELVAAKTGDCSDCPACAGSETAQCKCEQGSTVSLKLADNKTPASSCCGKCAQEKSQVVALKTTGCDDCTECSTGDSAKCKCLDGDDSSEAKPADTAPPEKQ